MSVSTMKFYNKLMKKSKNSSLITLFSLIAVFLSIVDVFGLVVFDSESRILWVFILALVTVGFITFITVTFQNRRVANENPVNNIKE